VRFVFAFKTYFDRGSIRRRMKVYDHNGFKHFNGVHWYPRICVYDRKFTWETSQHMEHEFYGDYGAYDVELDLPSEYVNEATGKLLNPDEVYMQMA
jgi:aminopeptidase N